MTSIHADRFSDDIPEGFVPFRGDTSGFVGKNGPTFIKKSENSVILGFKVRQDHCNKADNCHGGWLASVMDMQLATAVISILDIEPAKIVTVNMSLDYIAPAPLGSWVQGSAEILREGRKMFFTQGLLYADEALVMRGNGLFKTIGR